MLEIEIKVKVEDLEPFRTKFLRMGAEILHERHREDNTLYDFRTADLRGRGEAFRLRVRGKKGELTFKGPAQKSRRFKIRPEFETEIRRPKQAAKILKSLGLVPVFRYAKHRTVLKLDRVRICLDETSKGYFLEFEGERHRIAALSRRLGIPSSDWIKKTYVELLKS